MEVYRNSGDRGSDPLVAGVEARVSVIDYADRLTGPLGLRRMDTPEGTRWVGRCPIRPNDTRMPTFAVDPYANRWRCSACQSGGGVIDLAKAVARCDAPTAAGLLAGIYFAAKGA